jgi:moderate conductance mechanosensitive channel
VLHDLALPSQGQWLTAFPAADTSSSSACADGKETFCFHAASAVDATIHIAIIVVLAFVGRYLVHRLITRIIRRTATGLPMPLARLRGRARELLEITDELPVINERREQRAHTIGSVLKSCATAFVFGTAFVMVLRELGLDITPVLTGAGIVGVAIGFGAQNLVKDFLSGMFMILEDQYGVGDVIDAGPASGTVEAVGLRSTRVRDVNGTVWHIRNGEITRVGNMSQNWSRAVLDIPVPYDSDIGRIADLLESVATEVARDPDWVDCVIEDPSVWGVEQLSGDGPVLRLVIKTKPLKQWDVAREVRARIKVALDEAGLRLPTQQQSTVWMREPVGATTSPSTARGDGAGDRRQADGARQRRGPEDDLRP